MTDDTAIGGPRDRFPTTHWSALAAARSPDPDERTRALDVLVAAYWKPVYKYIRLRWGRSNEDAKDLTQGFFLRVIEKDFLADYDPAKARLRTFLRTCLDAFLANQERDAQRLKRGGDTHLVSLDFEQAEHELAHSLAAPADPEEYFEREWARSLFALAVERFREQCAARGRSLHFRLFEIYDLDDSAPTYAQLAGDFGLSASDVTNYLASARREFRGLVLETLRDVTATEDEFRREARALLGVDPA
ncbi:MAG TPA: sigma-70 family RNA polymerase sigma factor [Terriglobales bacterium]|jgi:RNA polymerase sigma factor (sigma-70 family)|nr:sigma-70 family RNA polymerase sigma factor [Terriglobales bacterium]